MALKSEDKKRYLQRMKERSAIQIGSSQFPKGGDLMSLDFNSLSGVSPHEIVAKNVNSSKHLRNNESFWNNFEYQIPKYVDQAIRPISVRREDEHIKEIKKRVNKERAVEFEKMRKKSEKHDHIRS
mmetsp:Transcript_18254/g.15914  ORF Transcript_18254/g.15914 Transcript_18254/m.15914 type:complete len:126 (-) Transcript_18254:1103-1480(-)